MKNTIRLLAVMLYCLNLTGQTSEETLSLFDTLNEKIETLSSQLKKRNEKFSKNHQLRNGISMIGGYSENGYGIMANLHYYPNKNINRHFEIGGYAGFMEERKTGYNIPVELYSLNIGYFIGIPFLSSKNDAFRFSIGAGGTIGNESIDVSEIQLDALESISTEDGAVYGFYGAVESDIKIFTYLSGVVRYTHFHHPKSDIGKTKFLIGLGLNFKF
ncbi:conjugal transfer protein TraO [Aquimarina macrocephali]|uniref:conjugal transfer protein TraO n=1 Tax=Aquimarina macrocephali TaxID=666563 RepID=UPI003F66C936